MDDTDGKTQETALTIANTDIRIWKEGGLAEVNKNSGGATHMNSGRYYTVLDATDTNTFGKLEVNVHVTGALPVRREFMVLPTNVYDSLLLGTDNLDVSAIQLAGQTITAAAGVTFPSSVASPTNITGGTITTVTTTTNLTNLPSIPNNWLTAAGINAGALNGKGDWNIGKTGYSLTQAFPANFSSMSISVAGLLDIGTGTGLTAVPWNAAWDAEVQSEVQDAIEANHLDHLLAADYDPTSKPGVATALLNELIGDNAGVSQFTVNALENAPSGTGASAASIVAAMFNTDTGETSASAVAGSPVYEIVQNSGGGGGPTAADIRAEIDANSTQLAAILADTAEIGAAGAGLTALASAANLSTLTGYVDTEVSAIKAKTDNLPASFPANFGSMSISAGGLVDITQAAADKAWSTTARILTAGTNIVLAKGTGITGFNDLDASGVATATWNAATASYGFAGSYGALIETNLDAPVSTAGGGSLTAAGIADAVWDEALSGHATVGSAGAGLSAAGSAGDPWSTLLPGSYAAGTAGKLITDTQSNLNTLIGYVDTEIASNLASVKVTVDANLDVPVSTVGGGSLTAATIADAVWDEAISGHATVGSTGSKLSSAATAGDPWSTALPGSYGAGTAGKLLSDNLNATVSSRATQTSVDTLAGYVDTEVAAIKAKTDNLPVDPADASDVAAAFSGVNTKLDTIDDFLDTEIAAIKTKTDFLPSATAGAAGGLFIAGTNAATTVNITGNLSGSVGSVTGAVGSVTGAVGSVAAGVTLAATTHTGAVIPTVTTLTNLPSVPAGWLTAAGIAAGALNGKGDWNVGKTGYSLTQAFPTNFASMSISVGGLVDITQTAADKAWGTSARTLTAGTNIALAKGTGITGFNDLDAAATATAVWNAATASYGSAGSYGLLIETNLDVPVSTAGGGGGGSGLTADQITALSSILGIPVSGTTPIDPTTGILDTIRDLNTAIKAKTDNLPADPADASDIATSFGTVNTKLDTIDDLLDTEIASIKTDTTTIIADTNDIQARIPAALVGGKMDANLGAINGSTTALTAFHRAVKGNVIGTVGGGSTTTSIVSSSLTPAGSVADKFKGRLIIFADDTTTANLRGQATDITGNTSAAAPTFTVTALTTAPVSGDVFVVV
ncbi:MAG TPA: hypothetical protein VFS89_06660 [Nitrosospira sp.]|nr:hypothetical protein [Nitrosospira sp.]